VSIRVVVLALALVLTAGASRAAPGITGLASWYGSKHEGHLTASGCRFDPAHLAVAHRTLPLGTWLRVRHRHRVILVRVEDRGPYVAGRILDLSRAAAERLDMVAAGVVMVQLEVIKLAPITYGRCIRPPAAPETD
jgi:rare lipoprotein A